MQPPKVSMRQEIREDIEKKKHKISKSLVEPFETPISKNHTLDTSLDQKTSKVPKEYRV